MRVWLRAPFRSPLAVVLAITAMGLAATPWSGCIAEKTDCETATLGCPCSGIGRCDPGLTCVLPSGICMAASPGTDAAMSPVPPQVPVMPGGSSGDAAAPPPLTGAVDAGGTSPLQGDAGAPVSGPTWTIFIYGHGDHNLSPALAVDLAEMNLAKLTPNVRVVFLADWDASQVARGTERFPTGAFWYRIRGNGQAAESIGAQPELDLDDPNVMAGAIKAAFAQYPSDRYGLVLWDHGAGWLKGFGNDTQDGKRPKPEGMRVSSVAAAVRAGVAAAGLVGPRRLDFLAFDTCLLGTAEVAAEFSDVTKVLIANAELDYGDGLDYTGALGWLGANPGAPAGDFAIAEAKIWDTQHRTASISDQLFRSHVAIDLEKFATFTTEFAALVTQARANGPLLARALSESVPSYYKSGDGERDSQQPPTRDVGLLLERIKGAGNPALAATAERVANAARAAKLAGAAGDLRGNQIGIGLFGAPVMAIGDRLFPLYPTLAGPWERASGWGQLLAATKAAAPRQPPVVTGNATVPPAASQADPPRVDFAVAGADTATVSLVFFELDPKNEDRLLFHGNIGSSFVGAGTQTARWFGRTTSVNSTQPMPVTFLPWQFAVKGTMLETALRKVPGLLQGQNQGKDWTVEASLIVDDNDVAAAIELGGQRAPVIASLREIYESNGPDTVFVPTIIAYNITAGTYVAVPSEFGARLPANGQISFKEVVAPPGLYGINVQVDDVWGNQTQMPYVLRLETSVAQ
jgi:hypothetical protein